MTATGAGLDIRPMTEDDREAAFPLYMEAFGGGPQDLESLADAPLDDRWVATDGGRMIGALRVWRFAHFFGGRSVPTAGIAAVAISPTARGRGTGVALMRETLRATAADGLPLSTLFMSTMAPYRAVGYELAGVRNRYRAALPTLPRTPSLAVEPWGDDELAEIMDCHRRVGATQNGVMDRNEDWWHKRVIGPHAPNEFVYRYLVRDGEGVVRGYVIFTHHKEIGHFPDNWAPRDEPVIALAMRDLMFETEDAARSLLTFAAGHWSSGTNMYWSGPAVDPLLTFFRDRLPTVDSAYAWMARLSDVAGCLTARGYPPNLDITTDFEVTDPTLDTNAGAYRLTIEGGKASVERIDSSPTKVHVRGLAAMYTSSLHPNDAVRIGLLQPGSEAAPDALAAAFAGPAPWLLEFF
jgi:predicted acetyltransferase